VAVAIAPKAPVYTEAGAAQSQAAAGAANADAGARFAAVQGIVRQRCVSCHAAHPTQPGFATAPAGVMLDDPHGLQQNAARIYQQAVQLKAMPLANMTNMTDAERAQVAAWFESGARTN